MLTRLRFPVAPVAALLAAFLVGGLLASPLLLGSERLAFRDVSHFYRPLLDYLTERSDGEWFPLWNPLDDFGMPVAGETSTAIFYPLRIIFFVAGNTDRALFLYIASHWLLAGAGAYRAARWTGAAKLASLLAGVGYPASGMVFFLYTNPPYLVGAAWLPWILVGIWRAWNAPSPASAARAAIPLALCIFGGDPQTAFHAVLVGGLVGLVTAVIRGQEPFPTARVPLRSSVAGLGGVCLLAALLALPQIWASLDWSAQSWRAATAPHAWIERPAQPPIAQPNASHDKDIYAFSLAPWHLIELGTPFVSGHLSPINSRISQWVPGDPRMWTPTIYCGLIPCIVLLSHILHPARWNRWVALVVIGIACASGEFAFGYYLRVLAYWMGGPAEGGIISDASGGAYWLLVQCIPGYGQFRYPAKWLPLAALGMSVFAASRLSAASPDDARRYGRWATAIAVIASIALAVSLLPWTRHFLNATCATFPHPDRFWGPIDAASSLLNLRQSCALSAVLGTCLAFIWHRQAMPRLAGVHHAGAFLLLLMLCEMGLVVLWQISTVPVALGLGDPPQARSASGTTPPRYLLSRAGHRPPAVWQLTSSLQRAREVERWSREVWYGRWHLQDRVAVVNNSVSIRSARSMQLWTAVGELAEGLEPESRERFLSHLRAQLCIAPPTAMRAEVSMSPSWIQWDSRWTTVDAGRVASGEHVRDFVAGLLRDDRELRPLVEVHADQTVPEFVKSQHAPSGSVTALRWSPSQVECRLRTASPVLLRMMQFHDGHWRAEVRRTGEDRWREVPLHVVNVVGQGIFVGPGDYEIRFRYRPAWFWPSVFISLLTAAVIAVSGFGASRRFAPHGPAASAETAQFSDSA